MACQTQGAGCSLAYPCCSGLRCAITSSIWGFCQTTNVDGFTPTPRIVPTTAGTAATLKVFAVHDCSI